MDQDIGMRGVVNERCVRKDDAIIICKLPPGIQCTRKLQFDLRSGYGDKGESTNLKGPCQSDEYLNGYAAWVAEREWRSEFPGPYSCTYGSTIIQNPPVIFCYASNRSNQSSDDEDGFGTRGSNDLFACLIALLIVVCILSVVYIITCTPGTWLNGRWRRSVIRRYLFYSWIGKRLWAFSKGAGTAVDCVTNRVFGIHLTELALMFNCDIPEIVKELVEEIERRGLYMEGLYRKSGTFSAVQAMRKSIDAEIDVDFTSVVDIHELVNLLKLFLNSLPMPLVTNDAANCIHNIWTETSMDAAARFASCREALVRMSKPHWATLCYLFRHFKKVSANRSQNLMDDGNLAKALAATVFRCLDMAFMETNCDIFCYLLANLDDMAIVDV